MQSTGILYLTGMKKYVLLLSILLTGIAVSAQYKTAAVPAKYDIAVSFNSICCGPPSADFLKTFVKKFNKDNKVLLNASIAGGCGREGEFSILFSLSGLKAKPKAKFMAAIKTLIPQQQAKNKTANNSSGNMELSYNVTAADFNNCRSGIAKWE
jgi:hypothetical protein